MTMSAKTSLMKLIVSAIILLLIMFLTGCASVCTKGWTKSDTALELTALGLTGLDHQQTLMIARNPQVYHELNPILGLHPSVGAVNGYFTFWYIVHPVIACVLTPNMRTSWQLSTIVLEGALVPWNYSMGLKP